MICGVTFGGTQFSDKPSFSDVAAWMVAADVSIQMILKMILDFLRHRNKQKNTLHACRQCSCDALRREATTVHVRLIGIPTKELQMIAAYETECQAYRFLTELL